MATKVKTYKNIYVSKLRPNSIQAEKVLSRKLSKALTSKQIVSLMNKELDTEFKYEGHIGLYLIYKAMTKTSPYYYVLNISL